MNEKFTIILYYSDVQKLAFDLSLMVLCFVCQEVAEILDTDAKKHQAKDTAKKKRKINQKGDGCKTESALQFTPDTSGNSLDLTPVEVQTLPILVDTEFQPTSKQAIDTTMTEKDAKSKLVSNCCYGCIVYNHIINFRKIRQNLVFVSLFQANAQTKGLSSYCMCFPAYVQTSNNNNNNNNNNNSNNDFI